MIGTMANIEIGNDSYETTGTVEIVGYTPDATYEVNVGAISASISLTVDTKKFARAMKRCVKAMMLFGMAAKSVKWKHSRARGENQQGRFRGIPRWRKQR